MLTNKACTVLYVGVTNNLERRVYEHKNSLVGGFTKKYNVHTLVWWQAFGDIEYAIEREKQIKRWARKKKEYLINEKNPH